nr:MAG: RNA-dependent RNA polymerase [Inner Mongolia bromovirus]
MATAVFSLDSLLNGSYGVDTPEEIARIRAADAGFRESISHPKPSVCTLESVLPASRLDSDDVSDEDYEYWGVDTRSTQSSDCSAPSDEVGFASSDDAYSRVTFNVEDLNALSDAEIFTVFEHLIAPTYVGSIQVPSFCRNKFTLSVSVARNLLSSSHRYHRKLKVYADLVAAVYTQTDIFSDESIETDSDDVPGYVFHPVERANNFEPPPICPQCGFAGYQCPCADFTTTKATCAEMTLSDAYEIEGLCGVVDDATLLNNLGSFLMPIHCEYSRVDEPLKEFYMHQPHPTDRVSVEVVQAVCCTNLPTHVNYDDTYHQTFVECSDYTTDLDHIKLRQSDLVPKIVDGSYLLPVLNTGSGSKRVGTTKEVLTAIKKRNADVPELSGSVNLSRISVAVTEKFFSSYFNRDKLAASNFLNVVGNFHAYMEKWASSGLTYDDLPDLHSENLQFYEHMIKSDVKPVVADTLNVDRPIPATITFHKKGITSQFSPLFVSLFERFQRCLKERVIVPVGKISSLEMDRFSVQKYCLEIDLSKFDKSQGELHLMIQEEILKRLGCPVHISKWWCDFHRYSYISDKRAGVSMPISFQRRTGDAFTYFGNTMVTMALFAWCYDIDQFERVIFFGDDSLAFARSPIVGNPDLFTSLFNMEAKVMDPPTPYICSKFLLTDDLGHTFSVPDPLRELQRLGTKKIPDAPDENMLYAHFMSFVDRLRFMPRMTHNTINQLCIFFEMKYKKSGAECHAILGSFVKYSTNFQVYKELYLSQNQRFSLINTYSVDSFVVERKRVRSKSKSSKVSEHGSSTTTAREKEIGSSSPSTQQKGSGLQKSKRIETQGVAFNEVSTFRPPDRVVGRLPSP